LSQIGSDSVARITADSASDLVIIANGGLGSEDRIAASADGGLTSDVIQATLSANTSFNLTNVTGIDSLDIGRSGGAGRVTATVTTGTDPIAVSLSSTASADSLSANVTAYGAVTVSAGAGNDVVAVASNVKSVLTLGEGNNLVTGATGDTLSVTFGAGADSLLAFNAMYDDVIMGAGDDIVQATGTSLSGVTVSGGSGRDTIEITGDSVIVNDDLAYVTDFEVIRINTNAAGDSITLDGDSIAMDSVATGFYLTGSDTIRLEDFAVSPSIFLTGTTGSTVVLLTADSDMNVSVYADSLNSADSIQAAGANDRFFDTTDATASYDFTGSTSIEYITLTAGDSVNATTSVVIGTGQSLTLNGGIADSVSLRVDFVSSSTSGTVTGGDLADVIILSNTSKASVSVRGGADSIYADGSDTLSINAGEGADTVSIDGAYDVVDLGGGNDLLVLSSASLSTLIAEGGAGGQDTIRLANSSAATMAASVLGGVTGFEVLDLSANGTADSVTVVGTQFSTVVVGDADWVTFTAAGTVPLSASSSAGRVVSSDSVASMTLTADSLNGAAVAATDTLSLAGPADVLNITGTGATTFDGSNVSGLELINVSSRSARTVNFSNIEVALTVNAIAPGDTLTSLVVGVNADAADTSPQTIVVNASTGAGADSVYIVSGDTLSTLSVNLGLGSDTVIAGIGDDVILVSATGATSADSDYINAGAGNDSIETGNGNDTIITGSGNDTAIAGAGSDSVFAGASGATRGTSYINLGSGNDTLTANADSLGDFVTLGGGMDSVVLGSGSDWVIVGSDGDTDGVYLDLGGGANYASLEAGADTVIGGSGADTVFGGNGANVVALGGGNDGYTGGAGADSVSGGSGNDTISLLAGNDTVFGEAGNDSITSGEGADYVDGGDGNDTIDLRALVSTAADSNTGIGGAGDDSIVGGFGKNSLLGGTGADIIIGGDDADSIVPGEDWDTVTSGGGNDTVVFLSGNELTSSATGRTDIVDGGSGFDYLKLVASSTGDTYTPQSLGAVTNFEAVIVDDSSATDLNTVKLDTYLLLTGTSGLASPRYAVEFTGQQLAYLDLSGVGVQASAVALDVTLGSSIAGATVSDVGNNAVKVTVTAGDSISSDLMFLGGSDDTLSLTGFTMSSGAFDADSVSAGTLLIAGDSTKTYAVTWANSFNTQDMVISVTGAGADSTAFVWNSDGADSVGITLVGHLTAGDTITTGDDNDSIVARGGLNSITSGAGNDFISGGDSVDVISFGAGQKSVYSFGGSDIITSSGADTAAVFIWLGDGGDSVSATSKTGIVTIDLGTGADTVRTGSGADVIFAQVGDTDGDVVASGAGNDSVVLLSGNDNVDLGLGKDTLIAVAGNDVVVVTGDSLGRDWIELGAGNDIFTNAAESTSGSYIDLGTGLDTVLIGGSSMSTGGDSVFATASDTMADVVSTGGGADYISLGDGADSIMSGSGNDTIYAGGGADSVYPGEGVDLVYLGTDTVTDYLFMANSISGGYESSRLAMDTVYNFDWDTDGAGTVDAIYDLIQFTGSFDAAVSVGAADFITDGVVNPLIIQGAANGVIALNSILVESGNSTNRLASGEVFAFEVAGSTYVAVANGPSTVGTVIQLVGVTGVVKLSEVGSDAFYLLGPTGG
jgi:Ca2+-binding RTX toxin-like protein